ncbi:chemotaxis protein CheA [Stieleria varia]|uniref:histidine kinase n=1 Tax=Stieleria varia TaxID=2528005 RepID=A0A5C6B427_9BACT|nr:chemotaxis protein CheA [Stieleria varia]TWU06312.1 Chemotaxis protein CheA [Stieleria varia]
MQDDNLLCEFVEEAKENLGDLETQLLRIDELSPDIDDNLVNQVFRAVHSVKGAAGFLGLRQINTVAHRLENVLGKFRDHQLVPDSSCIDILLAAADRLRSLVDDVENSNRSNNDELCSQLEALCDGEVSDHSHGRTEVPPNRNPIPSEKATNVSTSAEQVEVADRVERTIDRASAHLSAATVGQEHKSSTGTPKTSSAEPTVRVGVRVLDQLMNLAGELVLSRNQLLRVFGEQAKTDRNMDAIVSGIDQVTTELQESIMQTRMQPIGNVFNRFPRVIRSLSGSLGKQITMQMEGTEVETDKTIIEAIIDPLTHLVRNACDHGIETPNRRVSAGKAPEGTLLLKAFHKAGKMVIEIIDDGAGIDPNGLRDNAVSKGILSYDDARSLSDHDAVNLIFAPGFSTAKEVTSVSGRGVGMDVVRTNIERLGGNIDVKSRLGDGTTIRITLPLTLAIVPSMIVLVDGRPYALPQTNIVELVQTGGQEKRIERVSNVEVLRLRGALIPLFRLRDVLRLRPDGSVCEKKESQLVVVESGRSRFALVVDSVLDSEEIVVKPLGRHLSGLPLLAGSTILGDGRVAMILDASGIANRMAITNDSDTPQLVDANSSVIEDSNDRTRVVLLSVSDSDHFAVPMDIVSRIERVNVHAIDSIGNRRVLQYRGGTLPLIEIADVVSVSRVDPAEKVHVVVFDICGREVGLLAPYLDDICDTDLCLSKDHAVGQRGILGVSVINGRTTRVLDIYDLTDRANLIRQKVST